MCISRLVFVAPRGAAAARRELADGRVAAAYVAVFAAACAIAIQLRDGVDAHFLAACVLSAFMARAATLESASSVATTRTLPENGDATRTLHGRRGFTVAVVAAITLWGLVPPILGLQQMSGLTMYGTAPISRRVSDAAAAVRHASPTRRCGAPTARRGAARGRGMLERPAQVFQRGALGSRKSRTCADRLAL